jgi:predicted glutamine amidotransferase
VDKILLATTIAPYELDNQKAAIDSWINAGFDVVIYNTEDEILRLKEFFPNERFVALNRSAMEVLGKPYLYVSDVFRLIKTEPYSVLGLINSDIYIKFMSEGIKQEIVKCVTSEKLVYAHRMDTLSVDPEDVNNANRRDIGIDVFFFGKNILNFYQDDGFILGNPGWDLWMVLNAIHQGLDVIEIRNAVFYHIVHNVRWNGQFNQAFKMLEDKFFKNGETAIQQFHKINTRVDHGFFHVQDYVERKKILIVVNKNDAHNYANSLVSEAHDITVIESENYSITHKAMYDFLFWMESDYRYIDCAIDLLMHQIDFLRCDYIDTSYGIIEKNNGGTRCIYKATEEMSYPAKKFCNKVVFERVVHKFNDKIGMVGIPIFYKIVQDDYDYLQIFCKLNNFYLYPAGKSTKRLLSRMKDSDMRFKLRGIYDKEEKLWGHSINGISVLNPESLYNIEDDAIVIITSENSAKEIYNELITILPENKLICLNHLLMIDLNFYVKR